MSRKELSERLKKWRDVQAIQMELIKDVVLSQRPCSLESESLFLPSHFSPSERVEYGLGHLAEEETQLREGHAWQCILQLRLAVKTISIMQGLRKKNVRGQKQNTRARDKVHSTEFTRDHIFAMFHASRNALYSLGALDDRAAAERFPNLTVQDLVRKPTHLKRQVGDSRRPDGNVWVIGAIKQTQLAGSSTALEPPTSSLPELNTQVARGQLESSLPLSCDANLAVISESATQMSWRQRKASHRNKSTVTGEPSSLVLGAPIHASALMKLMQQLTQRMII
jgi:hypothetical protein